MLLGTLASPTLNETFHKALKESVPPPVKFLKFAYEAVSDTLFDSDQAWRGDRTR